MNNTSDGTKIGAGHASAMARMGLRELRAAFYPESNVAQPPEMGLYGTATPHEVHQSRHGEGDQRSMVNDPAEARESILSDRLQQAEAKEAEPPQQDRQQERE